MTVGIDEVGRGCWAGPLVAGAVLLGDAPLAGLKDSKLLSKQQRERLDEQIRAAAIGYGLGWVTPAELDKIGLTEAVRLAMQRALAAIIQPYKEIVVDGNFNFFAHDARARALIKADNLIPAVSAASIIAKVARDQFMAGQAAAFPGYGFEKHVGYGTAAHRDALQKLGLCELHRRSFKPIRALSA
jgi:ribonuclease HII